MVKRSQQNTSQSVIQKNALEDTAVTNKMQWDNSISFMERILKERIDFANDDLEKCIGRSNGHVMPKYGSKPHVVYLQIR